MNKDIIYIEPEDDITDIVAKIKSAKQKVVALVPPKKLGVLTSAINVKLIAKTAKAAKKAVVLVTDHPSLMKLAAICEIPVAATLQSRPVVPSSSDIDSAAESADNPTIEEAAEEAAAETSRAEIAEDFAKSPEQLDTSAIEDELAVRSVDENPIELNDDEKEDSSDASTAEAEPKAESSADTDTKKKTAKSFNLPAWAKNRKLIIAGVIALVLIIVVLVWANVVAPAASILVKVGTTSANFSENVSFTTNQSEEDAESGRFYLERIEHKESLKGKLEATEEKDIGEKASGAVAVAYTFENDSSVTLAAGTAMTQKGYQYFTAEDITLSPDDCKVSEIKAGSCSASAQVKITAAGAGDQYNCDNGTAFTVAVAGYSASATTAISGGSSKVVKVVQQSDIDTATSNLQKLTDTEAKEVLKKDLKDGYILIDSSYSARSEDPKPSVELGAEAGSDATISVEITYSIYAVDATQIETYIRKKANLGSDQKIYDLGSPYIERFTEADGGAITGKLKTTYKAGPEVTSELIMDKVRGRKVGEASSMLRSINGINEVKIDTSFFWVSSIPDDPNKITINIEVEE